jgi:putative two-component system response regulator
MVVDDDAVVRSSLARLLRAEGFQVALESSAVGAVESVRLLRPDLILLDVVMPERDGFAVCRDVRGEPGTRLVPIVMLTGLSSTEDRIRALEAGADDFLTKPVERAELLARARSLVRVKRYTDQLERAESVLLALARSIEGKDPCTEGHCERLSASATALGRRLGLSEEDLTALDRAGIVHDIGKVAVPDAVLLKPGPLTDEEWALMRKHPVTGEHICGPIHSFRKVLPIVRHHHERWDGSGYPDGLKGEEIPLAARVLQVVDVYDALSSERPYKRALRPRQAIRILREEAAKGWWDAAVVAEFERLIRTGGRDG